MKQRPYLSALLLYLGLILLLSAVLGFRSLSKEMAAGDTKKLAVLRLNGDISNSQRVNEQIRKVDESANIAALVIRINSSGGEVTEAQEIYYQLKKLRENKKVVISLGPMGVSAAYYVALGSHKIIANPGTLTGSIGTVVDFYDLDGFLRKHGVDHLVIKSGKYKSGSSYFSKMEEGEKLILQEIVNSVGQQFIETVIKERKLSPEQAMLISDGRLFSGQQALEINLIDALGGLQDAVDTAAELSGIEGKPQIIYLESSQVGFWKRLLKGKMAGGIFNFR